MELFKSKIEFDTDLMISEINQHFYTGSVSNDNLKMENNHQSNIQFSRLKYFNESVLPIFEGCEFENIFLFFAQPSGGLFWHKDGGNHYRRFIFPISSNSECVNWFKINDKEESMIYDNGFIYWFDTQNIEHTVVNNGNSTRVAFLFDVIYEEDKFKNILDNNFDKHEVFDRIVTKKIFI